MDVGREGKHIWRNLEGLQSGSEELDKVRGEIEQVV
jgi:hypothetical protein